MLDWYFNAGEQNSRGLVDAVKKVLREWIKVVELCLMGSDVQVTHH